MATPVAAAFSQHAIEIERVGIARQQQPTSGVTDDREEWIVHRAEHPRRHLLLVHAEAAVDRADDEVEPAEGGLVVVERHRSQDVGLDALQHSKALQALRSPRRSRPTAA